MKHLLPFIVLSLGYTGCSNHPQDLAQSEIFKAEEAFCNLVHEKGMYAGFVAYADENARLLRNDSVIVGRTGIEQYYRGTDLKNLTWKPEEVFVSDDGTMGHTWGWYTLTLPDTSGGTQTSKGIFHTVWKKQPDGTWKFIWD